MYRAIGEQDKEPVMFLEGPSAKIRIYFFNTPSQEISSVTGIRRQPIKVCKNFLLKRW